jgi:two-component system response regulator (stage 0 sporulation protein F)
MVIEDDPDLRDLLAVAFERHGLDAQVVASGREALAILTSPARAPEAIVTDVRLPEFSGITLLAGLRAGGFVSTPMIVMTAYADANVTQRVARLGVDALFVKPFDVDELCETLTEFVAHRRAVAASRARLADR